MLYFEINNIKFRFTLDLAFDRLVPTTEGWLVLKVVSGKRKNKNQCLNKEYKLISKNFAQKFKFV